MSQWYLGLSAADQAMVARVAALAVRHAVFGVMTVIDGALKVDPDWAPGHYFELRHVRGDDGLDVRLLQGDQSLDVELRQGGERELIAHRLILHEGRLRDG